MLLVVGCFRSAPPRAGRVTRLASAPGVPLHPSREQFLGRWQAEGEIAIAITTRADGSVAIETVLGSDAPWVSVINNVRWEADTLRCDVYFYYTGSEDLRTISNPLGDHPYSGVRNNVGLSLGERTDTLRETFSTADLPEPIVQELIRLKEKGSPARAD